MRHPAERRPGPVGLAVMGADEDHDLCRPIQGQPFRRELRRQLRWIVETGSADGHPRGDSQRRGCGGQDVDKQAVEESWR
jgi:hypothetical protein